MSGEKVGLHRYCIQHPDDACVSCYSRHSTPTPVPSEVAETTAGEREVEALAKAFHGKSLRAASVGRGEGQ